MPGTVVDRKFTDSVTRALLAAQPRLVPNSSTIADITLGLLAEGWTPPKPIPVTEEPLDPAVRLIGNNDYVFARFPNGSWVSTFHNPLGWRDLVEVRGPLYVLEERSD